MFAVQVCLLFGEFLSRLFQAIPFDLQIFLFVGIDVHRVQLFVESVDLLLNVGAHLQTTFLFVFLVSKIVAQLLDQIVALLGQTMNLFQQPVLHLHRLLVLTFEEILNLLEFILGLLDLILQRFQPEIHFVHLLLHTIEVSGHIPVFGDFLLVVLQRAIRNREVHASAEHHSKVFALRIGGDLVLQLLSTLHSLNIGFEMFQHLLARRRLMKSFVQVDFQSSRLLAERFQ